MAIGRVKQYGEGGSPFATPSPVGLAPFYNEIYGAPTPNPGYRMPTSTPSGYSAPNSSVQVGGSGGIANHVPASGSLGRTAGYIPAGSWQATPNPSPDYVAPDRNIVTQQPLDNTQYVKTLDDFLAKARSMLSADAYAKVSAQVSAIAAKEAALQKQAATSNANIGSGYSALGTFINGQAAPLAQNYDTASAGVTKAQSDAQKSITDSNAAAEAQQQAIMKMIGIGDTNIVLQNKGITNSAQTAANVANSALSGQSSRTQLAANKGTALTFNTNSGTAAALEGRSTQDSIQKQLMTYLAQLEDQKSSAQASGVVSEADVNSLAQSMMNQDMSQFSANYDRKYTAEKDAMNAAIAMDAANNSAAAPSTSTADVGILGNISATLQNSGLDGPTAQNVINAIQNLYNNNGGPITDPTAFAKAVSDSLAGTVDPVDISNAVYTFIKYMG